MACLRIIVSISSSSTDSASKQDQQRSNTIWATQTEWISLKIIRPWSSTAELGQVPSCELTNKFVETEEKRPFPIGSKQAGEAAMLLSFGKIILSTQHFLFLAYRNALQRAVRKFNQHAKMIELPAKTDHVRESINVRPDSLVLN